MIPRIIHQIWLGPHPVPEWTKSWMHIKGWSYKLWSEDELSLPTLQAAYDRCKNYYNMKSDLARLEILYKYGGLYLDCDCECLRPLPLNLFLDTDRFVPIYENDEGWPGLIANGIMGAEVHCPTILYLISKLVKVKRPPHQTQVPFVSGPIWMTKQLKRKQDLPLRVMPSILFLPEWVHTDKIHVSSADYPNSFGFHYWGGTNKKVPYYDPSTG